MEQTKTTNAVCYGALYRHTINEHNAHSELEILSCVGFEPTIPQNVGRKHAVSQLVIEIYIGDKK